MSPLIKNIATILVALTLAYLGYVLYTQNKESSLSYNNSTDSIQEMLNKNQIFIDRSVMLDKIELNTDILMKPLFRSYRSYRSPDVVAPVGRPNPFEADSSSDI